MYSSAFCIRTLVRSFSSTVMYLSRSAGPPNASKPGGLALAEEILGNAGLSTLFRHGGRDCKLSIRIRDKGLWTLLVRSTSKLRGGALARRISQIGQLQLLLP